MTEVAAAATIPIPEPRDSSRSATQLRRTINEVIGSVFFGPLMRAMRNSAIKGTVGHGGRGEEIFRAQLDQILTERAGASTHYPLSDVLFDRFAPAVSAQSGRTDP
ncbi:MAG: hypothetical protein V3U55_07200 [Mycobacterium sp.]